MSGMERRICAVGQPFPDTCLASSRLTGSRRRLRKANRLRIRLCVKRNPIDDSPVKPAEVGVVIFGGDETEMPAAGGDEELRRL